MIALSHDATVQQRFEQMLPRIRRQAAIAFSDYAPEARDDLVAEVVANAYCAFVRLAARGKTDLGYAVPLTMFAIRQVKDGRRVGSKHSICDVMSPYAKRQKGFTVQPLDRSNDTGETWQDIVVEDRHAGPDVVATTRIDFGEWLRSLPQKTRRIATRLAVGDRAGDVARRFGVSPSRISHIRRELSRSWAEFQGELKPVGA